MQVSPCEKCPYPLSSWLHHKENRQLADVGPVSNPFSVVVGEEWRHSLIGLDLALLPRRTRRAAGAATPARRAARLLDGPGHWPSARGGRWLCRTRPSCCADTAVPTSYSMKAAVGAAATTPPQRAAPRPQSHRVFASALSAQHKHVIYTGVENQTKPKEMINQLVILQSESRPQH